MIIQHCLKQSKQKTLHFILFSFLMDAQQVKLYKLIDIKHLLLNWRKSWKDQNDWKPIACLLVNDYFKNRNQLLIMSTALTKTYGKLTAYSKFFKIN